MFPIWPAGGAHATNTNTILFEYSTVQMWQFLWWNITTLLNRKTVWNWFTPQRTKASRKPRQSLIYMDWSSLRRLCDTLPSLTFSSTHLFFSLSCLPRLFAFFFSLELLSPSFFIFTDYLFPPSVQTCDVIHSLIIMNPYAATFLCPSHSSFFFLFCYFLMLSCWAVERNKLSNQTFLPCVPQFNCSTLDNILPQRTHSLEYTVTFDVCKFRSNMKVMYAKYNNQKYSKTAKHVCSFWEIISSHV